MQDVQGSNPADDYTLPIKPTAFFAFNGDSNNTKLLPLFLLVELKGVEVITSLLWSL